MILVALSRANPLFPAPARAEDGSCAPPVDVYETAGDVVVELELPGTRPGDVRVVWRPEGLLVEAAPPPSRVSGRVLRLERAPGPFRRLVPVPCAVDPAGGRAAVRDGVLTVRLPKAHAPR